MIGSPLFFILIAFMGSLLATLIIERVCHKIALYDNPGHRKLHKIPVPRLGGISFFIIPLIISFFLPMHMGLTTLIGALVVFAGGFYDDLHPSNSALVKLFFQVPSAFLFAFALDLSFFSASPITLILLRIVIAGYVLFMINAANLMDNMNGLTSGLSILWLVGLAFLSLKNVQTIGLTLTLLILAASILGFYLRNFPWGKIYMGDQGSQLLGYLNATMSVLVIPRVLPTNAHSLISLSFIVILLFSIVFITDVVTVTVIRIRERRPVWQGDQCHLSHQLVKRGFSQTKSALILAGIQGLCIGLGYWSVIYFSSKSF